MLTRQQLLSLLVGLAAVGDTSVLSENRNLSTEVCAPEDRENVRRIAKAIADICEAFDYTLSPEFGEAVEGKSPSVVAMKTRLVSDPVRRREQRSRFEKAIGELLTSGEAYRLVPENKHPELRGITVLVTRLSNPE